MPGYTTSFKLPYLLNSEAIAKLADTTKALADRLETILNAGDLRGKQGPAGPAGPTGPAGPAGPKGDAGPTGPKGDAGPAGATGSTGPTGPRGAQGDPGPTGPAGPKGDTGPAGPKGEAGTSLQPKGTVATAAALPTDLTPADAGLTYVTTDDGHVHMWSGTAWDDLGALQGPAGPAGATGPAGPKGDTGPAGATGPAAPKGDTGATGAPGATGPSGPKGDPGATGPAGPKGDTGPAGPKGDPGATGATGATGPKGDRGPTGPAGPATVAQVSIFRAAAAVSIPHNIDLWQQLSAVDVNECNVSRSGSTYTVATAGYYRVTGQLTFEWRNSNAERRLTLIYNRQGNETVFAQQTTACTNGYMNASNVVYLQAGDQVGLKAFHFTGSALSTAYASNGPAFGSSLAFEYLHA